MGEGGGNFSHIEETRVLVTGGEYNVKPKTRPLWGWFCRLELTSNGGHGGTE